MTAYKVDFKSAQWEVPVPGVRSKVYMQEGRQIRLVEFTAEFEEADWCLKGHVGYVLEGTLQVDFNGRRIVFDQGDGVFIPAGEDHKHMAKALTEVARLILVEEV